MAGDSLIPTSGTSPDHYEPEAFEIDVIYPRNETYNATETFPVVVAIQRPLVASRLGKFNFGAYIMPYSNWQTPGGIDVGNTDKWVRPYDAANFTDDPFFLIEVTDATRWNKGSNGTKILTTAEAIDIEGKQLLKPDCLVGNTRPSSHYHGHNEG
ncbi:unnamed protein product, partial [Clonostachys solani]